MGVRYQYQSTNLLAKALIWTELNPEQLDELELTDMNTYQSS